MKTYTKYILSCVAVTTMALAINSAHNTSVKTADLKDPSSFSFNAKSNDFAMHQPGTGTVTKVAFDGAGIRSKFGNSIDFGSSDSFPLNQKFDGFFAFQPGFGTLTTMWFASHSTQDKFSKAADFNDLNTFPPDTKFDNFSEFKFGFGTFLFVNEKGKLVKRFFRGEFANFFFVPLNDHKFEVKVVAKGGFNKGFPGSVRPFALGFQIPKDRHFSEFGISVRDLNTGKRGFQKFEVFDSFRNRN